MSTKIDTTNWVSYPFEVNGVNFVSMLDPQGYFYPKIEKLPAGMFDSMNKSMVLEFLGNPADLSHEELLAELDRVNEGGTQAIVALA
jgi:hypothetical protein